MLQSYPPRERAELRGVADHAGVDLVVGHPDGGVVAGGLLAALGQQILDALVDVRHPLLLLRSRRGVHGEGLRRRKGGVWETAIKTLIYVAKRLLPYAGADVARNNFDRILKI